MEDSSNGKLEEAQSGEEHKEVVVEDVQNKAIDIDDDSESANKRVISIEDTSESAEKIQDGNGSSSSSSSSDEEEEPTAEKGPQIVEEETVSDIAADSIDVSEEVVENEKEKVFPSLAVSEEPPLDESNGIPPVETGKGIDVPSSSEKASSEVVTCVVENAIEEKGLSLSDEKNETNSSALEETKLPILEDNTGEASDAAYIASSENVESSNAGEECGKPEIRENKVNPTIIPVTRRALQPTSWRSCCGLFEFLRRSDR
ncbi:hypothetical protein UlMin_015034 [Ulmus minor]